MALYSYGPLDVARVDDDRELLARLALEHHYLIFFDFFRRAERREGAGSHREGGGSERSRVKLPFRSAPRGLSAPAVGMLPRHRQKTHDLLRLAIEAEPLIVSGEHLFFLARPSAENAEGHADGPAPDPKGGLKAASHPRPFRPPPLPIRSKPLGVRRRARPEKS